MAGALVVLLSSQRSVLCGVSVVTGCTASSSLIHRPNGDIGAMCRAAGAVALWCTVLYKLNGTYNRLARFSMDEIQIPTQKAPSASRRVEFELVTMRVVSCLLMPFAPVW